MIGKVEILRMLPIGDGSLEDLFEPGWDELPDERPLRPSSRAFSIDTRGECGTYGLK